MASLPDSGSFRYVVMRFMRDSMKPPPEGGGREGYPLSMHSHMTDQMRSSSERTSASGRHAVSFSSMTWAIDSPVSEQIASRSVPPASAPDDCSGSSDDVGAYGADRSRVLEPGMVLTVEPGLYIAPDADVPAAYRGIGIRIEDDILITEDGNKNLTASVVKKADDIEALMAAARLQ